MKHLKMLGAVAVAAAALTALAGVGTASADFICTESNTPCGKAIASLESSLIGGTVRIKDESGTVISTCTGSKLNVKKEFEGVGVRVGGAVTALTWTGCTASTVTVASGQIMIENKKGTTNGTLFSGKAGEIQITVGTLLGSCVFTTGLGTDLGAFAGGINAAFQINAPLTRVSGPCLGKATWEGEYQVTNHTAVYVHAS
jgi:hypothetical protein